MSNGPPRPAFTPNWPHERSIRYKSRVRDAGFDQLRRRCISESIAMHMGNISLNVLRSGTSPRGGQRTLRRHPSPISPVRSSLRKLRSKATLLRSTINLATNVISPAELILKELAGHPRVLPGNPDHRL